MSASIPPETVITVKIFFSSRRIAGTHIHPVPRFHCRALPAGGYAGKKETGGKIRLRPVDFFFRHRDGLPPGNEFRIHCKLTAAGKTFKKIIDAGKCASPVTMAPRILIRGLRRITPAENIEGISLANNEISLVRKLFHIQTRSLCHCIVPQNKGKSLSGLFCNNRYLRAGHFFQISLQLSCGKLQKRNFLRNNNFKCGNIFRLPSCFINTRKFSCINTVSQHPQ